MRSQDFVKDTVVYHDELNPIAWEGDVMRPEVRDKLLQIADLFVQSLDVPDFEVLDVVLAGSLANYNWTRFSDFDVHVVTRYSDLNCDNIAEAFYRAKKHIWNDAHNIRIRGHECELYVEDINEPPVSQGVYSIIDNKWINTPAHSAPKLTTGAVNHKVQDLIVQIDHALSEADSSEDVKRIENKIRKMRRAGLDDGGEFSVENLAFKVLRNLGYFKKLNSEYYDKQDQELSLEDQELDEGWKDWALAGAIGLGAAGAAPTADAAPAAKQVPAVTHQVKQQPNVGIDLLSMKNTKAEEILHRTARAYGLKGVELAQFMAQCAHESADFSRMKEKGGAKYFAKRYDPKYSAKTAKILGNTHVGDGAKYFGRGYIQLTGRDNYRMAGDWLKMDLVKHPDLAARPDVAAKLAVWYWVTRVKPGITNFNDTSAVTKKINPAMRGLQDRQENFKDYKNVLVASN